MGVIKEPMVYRQKISYILLFFAFLVIVHTNAEIVEDQPLGDLKEHFREPKEVDWKEITGDEKFEEFAVKKKPEEQENQDFHEKTPSSNSFDFEGFRYIAIGIIGVILLVLLALILSNLKSNPSIKKNLEYSIAEAEENIDKSDLHYLLDRALEAKEYKLALRIHYLIVIKALNTKGHIIYKKEKTNYQYMTEMIPHSSHVEFKKLTHLYEYFWYGDKELKKEKYDPISKVMVHYVERINSKS